MTIHAGFAGGRLHLGDTDAPAFFRSKRRAPISGPALHIAETRNADGETLLQARRLSLLLNARNLRNQRRSKEASACEAELRAVTHQLLSLGEP